jgi:hypothetical protein
MILFYAGKRSTRAGFAKIAPMRDLIPLLVACAAMITPRSETVTVPLHWTQKASPFWIVAGFRQKGSRSDPRRSPAELMRAGLPPHSLAVRIPYCFVRE